MYVCSPGEQVLSMSTQDNVSSLSELESPKWSEQHLSQYLMWTDVFSDSLKKKNIILTTTGSVLTQYN